MTPADVQKLHPAYRRLARQALDDVRFEPRGELPDPERMTVEELRAEVEAGREAFEVVVNELADVRKRALVLERDRDYWRNSQLSKK